MTKSEKILSQFSDSDRKKVEQLLELERKNWVKELKPKADAFGLKRLPREADDPNSPFLKQFKTDKHTYYILGEEGVGFERYTTFQKRSLQRGFGRDFQSLFSELDAIKMDIAGNSNIGKMRSNAILNITGLQDAVADFGSDQFDAALWLCTLFILREGEKISEYSEKVAEEKIKDWAAYGYSELDFFLLSGSMVIGYGQAFQNATERNQKSKEKYLDVIATGGRLLTMEKTEVEK